MTCFSFLALSNITLNKKDEIIQLCRHCWSTDPFTLGGYSYPGPQTRAQARIILLVNVRNGKYFQIPRIKRFLNLGITRFFFKNYNVCYSKESVLAALFLATVIPHLQNIPPTQDYSRLMSPSPEEENPRLLLAGEHTHPAHW